MKTIMLLPSASTFLAFNPHDNNIIAIGTEESTIYIYILDCVDEVSLRSIYTHIYHVLLHYVSCKFNVYCFNGLLNIGFGQIERPSETYHWSSILYQP